MFDVYVWGRKVWPPPPPTPSPEETTVAKMPRPPLNSDSDVASQYYPDPDDMQYYPDPDDIIVPTAEAPPASTMPGGTHKEAGPQTDEELSLLGRMNRLLLKMPPEARARCSRWLAGRHGGL